MLFYFILTLPSLLIGIFLGFSAGKLFTRNNYLIFIFLYLSLCVLTLLEFYFNPQVYFFNPLIGYFPGNIYDENIPIDIKLIIYRILNLTFFLILAMVANRFESFNGKKKKISILSVLLISVMFFWLKPELGYSTTLGRLQNDLQGFAVSKNIDVIYDISIERDRISNFIMQSEYYFKDLSSQTKINFNDKITAVVFKDSEQKGELFGAKSADVAKPWLKQFYVEIDGFESSLKHEMAHIFAGQVGAAPFKVAENLNPAMIEGYAMAVEDEYDGKEIHYLAALALRDSININIRKLFAGFNFFGSTSSLSYILAGSFMKFLSDKYGIEKINQIYSDIDFQEYFGKDISVLESEYKEFLDTYKLNFNRYEADLYFGRLPLIKKVCARFAARQSEEGWKLYRDKKFAEALAVFEKLWEYSENYSSLLGIAYTLRNLNQPGRAIELLDQNLKKFEGSSYYFNLLFALGDLLALQNNLSRADSVYQRLIEMNPREDYFNIAFIRLKMIEDSTISVADYLNSKNEERLKILTTLFDRDRTSEFIPSIIELLKVNEVQYSESIQLFENFEFHATERDEYAAFYLYNYALENSDFLRAEKFIEIAMAVGIKSSRNVVSQNKIKNKWLLNNKDRIIINFLDQ